MLPQLIGYVRCLHSNKARSFKVSDKRLLKKCIKIWEKLNSLVGKNLIVNLFMVIVINT